MSKKATVKLSVQLVVKCPYCKEEYDLMQIDHDNDYVFSDAIFFGKKQEPHERWLDGVDVDCPCCMCNYDIGGVNWE